MHVPRWTGHIAGGIGFKNVYLLHYTTTSDTVYSIRRTNSPKPWGSTLMRRVHHQRKFACARDTRALNPRLPSSGAWSERKCCGWSNTGLGRVVSTTLYGVSK